MFVLRVKHVAALVVFAALALSGCKSNTRSTALQSKDSDGGEHHLLQGKVVSVDAPHLKVTIAHGKIGDYMPAMTMAFPVENQSLLTGIQPGDEVEADLVVQNNTSYLQSIDITKSASGKLPAPMPHASRYPQAGDQAADFHLVTENDKPITLASFRGAPLLLTFIYTRCPLPQFCPLLNIKFSELAHELHDHAGQYPSAHLLSVSIDPEHDTVPVLKEFSKRYAAVSGGNWDFATGNPKDVHDLATNMGIDYWPENGQVVHSLSTALIDKNGRIDKIWYGNDWQTGEALQALQQLR